MSSKAVGRLSPKGHAIDYLVGRRTQFGANLQRQGHEARHRLISATQPGGRADSAGSRALPRCGASSKSRSVGQVDGAPVSYALHRFPAERFAALPEAFSQSLSITAALAACGVTEYTPPPPASSRGCRATARRIISNSRSRARCCRRMRLMSICRACRSNARRISRQADFADRAISGRVDLRYRRTSAGSTAVERSWSVWPVRGGRRAGRQYCGRRRQAATGQRRRHRCCSGTSSHAARLSSQAKELPYAAGDFQSVTMLGGRSAGDHRPRRRRSLRDRRRHGELPGASGALSVAVPEAATRRRHSMIWAEGHARRGSRRTGIPYPGGSTIMTPRFSAAMSILHPAAPSAEQSLASNDKLRVLMVATSAKTYPPIPVVTTAGAAGYDIDSPAFPAASLSKKGTPSERSSPSSTKPRKRPCKARNGTNSPSGSRRSRPPAAEAANASLPNGVARWENYLKTSK